MPSRLRLAQLGPNSYFSRCPIFGRRPHPHLPRHLLFRFLAYRLQADVLGDLDSENQRLLDRFSNIGIGGEMHQCAWPIFFEYGAELLRIGNVAMLERAPLDRPNVTA